MAGICYNCFHELQGDNHTCPFCGFEIYNYETSPRALPLGMLLNGKYLVGRTLGEGGFGITYLAWDQNMKTKVAIKEYFPSTLVIRDAALYGENALHTLTGGGHEDFEAGLKRYVEEAAILAKFFNLPGIVSVKDFFYENETAYIVMEYIDGISLKEFLKSRGGKLSVEETLRIMDPIISSLAIVHSNRLLHRDISPDNIMLGRDGTVKLIDFGAARYFDGEYEKSMTVVLKHGYAPVEQYSRKGEQGAWTDIYGLCAVIYRMITGVIPEEAIDRVSHDGLKPIHQLDRKVPKYISQAVEKGLAVNPEDRQHNMQELHADLYISKVGLRNRYKNNVYQIIRRILVVLVILLVIVAGGTAICLFNRDKIDEFREKIETVFKSEEISGKEESDREENLEYEKENKKEKIEKEQDSLETADMEVEEIQAEVSQENQQIAQTADDIMNTQTEDIQQENVPEAEVEHAIIVARDGTLNGKSQSYTVGDILDTYSDETGTWTGYKDINNQLLIYYQGMKNGESFAIEFVVYMDDTFKVTGAAKNGEKIERYSDFFQEILNEVGI